MKSHRHPNPTAPSQSLPRLASLELLGGYRLRLAYEDGHVCEVELAQRAGVPIELGAFALANIDATQNTLGWPGFSERIDAVTLRCLAKQQADEPELLQFWQRLADSTLSLEQIGAAWGFGTPNSSSGHLQG